MNREQRERAKLLRAIDWLAHWGGRGVRRPKWLLPIIELAERETDEATRAAAEGTNSNRNQTATDAKASPVGGESSPTQPTTLSGVTPND